MAWPKEHLEENLKFIADSLGPTNDEQPRDTIRRYLATGFYKHHLSMYKKRPIYWLFSSGKQRAFQCLVYLHRYHEGTLARMRTEYVIPLQGKIAARIEQLEGDKAKATSTSHRKQAPEGAGQPQEAAGRTAHLRREAAHAADQRISLDLDDGVKVNYGKFGDLLAESKAVTGGKDDDRMARGSSNSDGKRKLPRHGLLHRLHGMMRAAAGMYTEPCYRHENPRLATRSPVC